MYLQCQGKKKSEGITAVCIYYYKYSDSFIILIRLNCDGLMSLVLVLNQTIQTYCLFSDFWFTLNQKFIKVQGRRQHGFDGFGRTHQFSEISHETHHLWEI